MTVTTVLEHPHHDIRFDRLDPWPVLRFPGEEDEEDGSETTICRSID